MDPNDYGYEIDVSINSISPVLFQGPAKPTVVPDLCNCKNCARRTCPCRIKNLPCSEYCGCCDNDCKNPFKTNKLINIEHLSI